MLTRNCTTTDSHHFGLGHAEELNLRDLAQDGNSRVVQEPLMATSGETMTVAADTEAGILCSVSELVKPYIGSC